MTKRAAVILLVAACVHAETIGPFTVSGNFPRDLYGPIDTRDERLLCNGPCIWGRAESATLPIQFYPPAGFRVRILRLRGDLVSWIKALPGDPPTPQESAAGVLGGFSTTAPGGSVRCDYCADNCFLYVQDAVTAEQPKARTPFDYAEVDEILGQDRTVNLTIASWLNTTGKPIHVEATYTVKFIFETIPE